MTVTFLILTHFPGKGKGKKTTKSVTLPENDEEPAPSSYVCTICSIHGEGDDELNGIQWFQCDFCISWYHYHCLSAGHQARVDLSLLCGEDGVQWACPHCADRVHRTCQVCLVEEDLFGVLTDPFVGSDRWAGCTNTQCSRFYHYTCLPIEERHLASKDMWYCPSCRLEE